MVILREIKKGPLLGGPSYIYSVMQMWVSVATDTHIVMIGTYKELIS